MGHDALILAEREKSQWPDLRTTAAQLRAVEPIFEPISQARALGLESTVQAQGSHDDEVVDRL